MTRVPYYQNRIKTGSQSISFLVQNRVTNNERKKNVEILPSIFFL